MQTMLEKIAEETYFNFEISKDKKGIYLYESLEHFGDTDLTKNEFADLILELIDLYMQLED